MSTIKLLRYLLSLTMGMLLSSTCQAAAYDCPGGGCPPNLSAYPPTAGIPTGMIDFGSTRTLLVPSSAAIDWGDGSQSTALPDCGPPDLIGRVTCHYWGHQHVYATPGLYQIVVTNNHGSSTAPFGLTIFALGKFLMVSIGDSVASGEGNPIVPKQNGHDAYWDYGDSSTSSSSNGCHGSSTAGPAQAARTIRSENPAARLTFIHQACSGAKVGVQSDSGPMTATGQLKGLMNLLPSRTKIDALLISAGANDVDHGFGNIINTCVGPYPGNPAYSTNTPDSSLDCRTDTRPPSVTLGNDLRAIPALDYAPLAAIIDGGALNVKDASVYIAEYFDPTHDAAGDVPTPVETLACSGNLLIADEWDYLYTSMLLPLNDRIKDVADQYGWHRVTGIAADFKKHGYCTASPADGWVVRFPSSITTQGDSSGSGHPNAQGHNDYAAHIVDTIYTWQVPVTTAMATTGGGTYAFDTWSHGDVMVTLSAINILDKAGTKDTKFSVDDPSCSDVDPAACMDYTGMFTVTASGRHTLYFLSSNNSDHFETVQTARINIDKPEVNDDRVSTTVGRAVSGLLQGSNPDTGDTLTFGMVAQPEHGTVTLTDVNKGSFTYEPTAGYAGDDSFIFTLSNGFVGSNNATETVTVADTPPTAQDARVSTGQDEAVSGQLAASDSDNGQTLTFTVVARPAHGTVSITDVIQGTYDYAPDSGYKGDDSFAFKVSDGYLDSNTAAVSVTVAAAPTGQSAGGSGGTGAIGSWALAILALSHARSRPGRGRQLD